MPSSHTCLDGRCATTPSSASLCTLQVRHLLHKPPHYKPSHSGFIAFVLQLEKDFYSYQFRQFAWTHMILTIILIPSSFFVSNIFEGLIWFLLPTSLVIVNDIFAYLAGTFIVDYNHILRPDTRTSTHRCLLWAHPADQAVTQENVGRVSGWLLGNRGGCMGPCSVAQPL